MLRRTGIGRLKALEERLLRGASILEQIVQPLDAGKMVGLALRASWEKGTRVVRRGRIAFLGPFSGAISSTSLGCKPSLVTVRETGMKSSSFRLGAENTRMTVAPSLTHASYQSLANNWGRSSQQRSGLPHVAPDDESQSHCCCLVHQGRYPHLLPDRESRVLWRGCRRLLLGTGRGRFELL